jgi:DNA-binding MarR family transcriptional regulator
MAPDADETAALPTIDENRHHAFGVLARTYQAVVPKLVNELETVGGIDSGIFSVLAYLDQTKPAGRMPFAELQQRMRVRYSQPGLSRLVQRMESDGLVERRANAQDGRAVQLILTRKGRAQYRRATTAYGEALERHFGRHISSDEAKQIVETLQPILARLDPFGASQALPS